MPTLFQKSSTALLLGALLALGAGTTPVRADVVTYISNLDEAAPSLGWQVAFAQWVASPFTTDNSAPSFSLDNLELNLFSINAGDGDLFVAVYSDDGGLPGTLLETGASPGPITAQANYTYTFSSTTLQPDTTYWIVAGMNSGSALYGWGADFGETPYTGNWTGSANLGYTYTASPPWSVFASASYPVYAVNATPVPEPGMYALAGGAAALGLALWRRKRR